MIEDYYPSTAADEPMTSGNGTPVYLQPFSTPLQVIYQPKPPVPFWVRGWRRLGLWAVGFWLWARGLFAHGSFTP